MKVTKTLQLFLLFFSVLSYCQNTATVSGNWNDCGTWGSPAAIYRNTTDTKTINNGVTVTANETWSTSAVQLTGNGAINFNSNIAIDFNTDQGADKVCSMVFNCSTIFIAPIYSNSGAYQNSPVELGYTGGDGRTIMAGSTTINRVTITWPQYTFPVGVNGVFSIMVTTDNWISGDQIPVGPRTFNFYLGKPGEYCSFTINVTPKP